MVLAALRSKRFKKNALLALLILIIPAFVLWGVGNMSSRPPLVGEIGKHKIYADEFEKSLQGIRLQILLAYYQNRDALNDILQNRPMLNYMTWERLIYLDAARKSRINVTNEDVRNFIGSHTLFQRDGKFDKTAYEYILRHSLSMDARQFEELVRQNLMVRSFRQGLLKNITMSPEEVQDYYNKSASKVELSYLLVPRDLYSDGSQPSPEEVSEYYENNKDLLYSPHMVNVEYIEVAYNTPEERTAAEAKIAGIYPSLERSPDKFIDTAASNNLRHAETGPFNRDEVVPGIVFFQEFHDVAFSLPKGEISRPIFSSPEKGAAYVLRKKEDLPPRQLAFDDVKDKITKFLSDQKSLARAVDSARGTYQKLSSSAITLDGAAAELNGTMGKTGLITVRDYIENIGPAQDIVLAALEAGTGNYTPPVPTEKGAVISLVETTVLPDQAEFEKNQEVLTKNLLARKQMAVLDAWLAANTSKVKLNKSLDQM